MLDTISHRGPDGHGIYSDDSVSLGHRRLAINDLTMSGHQPMMSEDRNLIIVFNGEIYNHKLLRAKFNKDWHGTSDTETFLACIQDWGIEKALVEADGMFAFALWNRKKRELTLARDRFGEKPLYYGVQGKYFIFASELKSIKQHPEFNSDIDWEVAASFLRTNYIPSPFSIFNGINKLPPGSYLSININDIENADTRQPKLYWSIDSFSTSNNEDTFKGSIDEATDNLEELLSKSIKLRSMADVEVGAFLSGGVDSSTVVSLMTCKLGLNVKTFTLGFNQEKYDESTSARKIADYLKTDHHEIVMTSNDVQNIVCDLTTVWDEPFADSSQIPTLAISKLASQNVKVVLSGDGGDELFYGYPQYSIFKKIWPLRHIRCPIRLISTLISNLPKTERTNSLNKKIATLNKLISSPNGANLSKVWSDRYRNLNPVIPGEILSGSWLDISHRNDHSSILKNSALFDSATYLTDDILVKVDRATMRYGLEARTPFLNREIFTFSNSLPDRYKISRSENKIILKRLMSRYLPKELTNRKKMGFSPPIGSWIRNELKEWTVHLLDSSRNYNHILDEKVIHQIWDTHLNKKVDMSEQLWGILCLLSFLENERNEK